jgi:Ca2+-transporting ATPase
VLLTLVLQVLLIYVPMCQRIFDTVPLKVADLGLCLLISTAVFWGVEAKKGVLRVTEDRSAAAPSHQ